jgi:hypothetical protein
LAADVPVIRYWPGVLAWRIPCQPETGCMLTEPAL